MKFVVATEVEYCTAVAVTTDKDMPTPVLKTVVLCFLETFALTIPDYMLS
jgi:hypothetical protein